MDAAPAPDAAAAPAPPPPPAGLANQGLAAFTYIDTANLPDSQIATG